MPFKNYDDALKYAAKRRLEEYEHIHEIQRRCYHNHIENERLRMRKRYQFKKECQRLRNILLF
jgi:hypothetical protein